MGNANKEKVQLVISHLEGCSGNFLGRLFADANNKSQSFFRIDTGEHPRVLAVNGIDTWDQELQRFDDHQVVVTHNFDQQQIFKSFPNAKIIQLYPYTHIGNVLYNICFKKVKNTLDNQIDNYFLHIVEWYQHIQQRRPSQNCTYFLASRGIICANCLSPTFGNLIKVTKLDPMGIDKPHLFVVAPDSFKRSITAWPILSAPKLVDRPVSMPA